MLAVAQLFDCVRRAAALGRPGVLALRHAAPAQNKSHFGLAARPPPSVWVPFAATAQPAVCGSPWSFSHGFFCSNVLVPLRFGWALPPPAAPAQQMVARGFCI